MAAKRKLKVKDKPELIRDAHSKALINTDRAAYVNHRARKRLMIAKEAEIKLMSERLKALEADNARILKLLESIAKNSNK